MVHPVESLALVDLASSGSSMLDKLESQNFTISFKLNSSDSLLSNVLQHEPSALVVVVDKLSDKSLNELAQTYQCHPLPILVFAGEHAPEALKATVSAGICSYVVDDVQARRLPVIIDLAIERFEQSLGLSTELKLTKQKLDNRKLIEKAKGMLMQQKKVTEEDAYSQMRRSAMNQGITMAELAQRIIKLF